MATFIRLKRLVASGSRGVSHALTGKVIKEPRVGFLSLPPEIRDYIYSLVALSSRLVKSRSLFRKAPALLLVNRQINAEYNTYLFSKAKIAIDVHNFDFKPVGNLIGSLYSKQLRALRTNKCLKLRLQLGKSPGRKDWENLRKWLAERTTNIDLLPWSYEVAFWPRDMPAAGRVTSLQAHASMISELVEKDILTEMAQFELVPILSCIETELYRCTSMLAQLSVKDDPVLTGG